MTSMDEGNGCYDEEYEVKTISSDHSSRNV